MIFTALVLSLAVAQSTTWSGKALGYKDQAAQLKLTLESTDVEPTTLEVGSIDTSGRFKFELPTVPEALLQTPSIRDSCGDATPGLKLAAFGSLSVTRGEKILGQLVLSNRPMSYADALQIESDTRVKAVVWIYANRAGSIVENCTENGLTQISNVKFVAGWNALTGNLQRQGENMIVKISNGYIEGLQRWFFVKNQAEQ